MRLKCPKCGKDKISISLVNGSVDKYGCRDCFKEWYPQSVIEKIGEPLAKAKSLASTLKPKVKKAP